MRTLVIETAGRFCSLALFDQQTLVAHIHEELGRGHAERILPAIASLPGGGRAERILVDRGPGSFTGVRIGYAAAHGLGLAWRVPVHGFGALSLVDASAAAASPAWHGTDRAIAVEGGHGQWFVGLFDRDAVEARMIASLVPEEALIAVGDLPAAGNRAAALGELRGGGIWLTVEADARHAFATDWEQSNAETGVRYGRAPDAKPLMQP